MMTIFKGMDTLAPRLDTLHVQGNSSISVSSSNEKAEPALRISKAFFGPGSSFTYPVDSKLMDADKFLIDVQETFINEGTFNLNSVDKVTFLGGP